MQWIICDLDGTVSNSAWRVHYALQAKQTLDKHHRAALYEKFHSQLTLDVPIAGTVALLQAWKQAGNKIVYVTGRKECYGNLTRSWLAMHDVPYERHHLLMREDHNHEPTRRYKQRMLHHIRSVIIDAEQDTIAFALEDDEACVAMYRENGILTLSPGALAA